MLLIAKIDQGIQPLNGLDPDRPAIAAVAAIRAAEFNEFLSAEADRATTATAGSDIDFGQVEKLHQSGFLLIPAAIVGGAGFRKSGAKMQEVESAHKASDDRGRPRQFVVFASQFRIADGGDLGECKAFDARADAGLQAGVSAIASLNAGAVFRWWCIGCGQVLKPQFDGLFKSQFKAVYRATLGGIGYLQFDMSAGVSAVTGILRVLGVYVEADCAGVDAETWALATEEATARNAAPKMLQMMRSRGCVANSMTRS